MSPRRTADQLVELVRELVRFPQETSWVEFKVNNQDPQEIGEYISALANSAALDGQERGYLVWGVRDIDHALVGTSVSVTGVKVGNEDLENWLLRLLNPQVHFEFHELAVDGVKVVVLQVDHAAHQPIAFKGVEFIRIGSHKKRLKEHPDHARRLWKTFDKTPFELGIAVAELAGSDVTALLDFPAYFELTGRALPDQASLILNMLSSERMIVRQTSGRWSITNLGAMLFAKNLEEFPTLHRKAARVVQYRASNRLETVKEQMGTRGYASGFKGLLEYVNNLLPSNEFIGQALRTTVRMYPDLALRELVANALIHQDFALTGTGPLIELFDNRIEITNPGTPLVDPARFVDIPPRSRNELLASVMRRVGICEERGSGWDKIAVQVEIYQLPAPLIQVTADHTKVTLFGHRALNEMDKEERTRAVYLHACLRQVNNENVTNASIRERFDIEVHNNAKASRLIKEAVEAGYIVCRDPSVGSKIRDYVPWWAAPHVGAGASSRS